jgi:protein-S-isoprenylcysteine O-methyltransferase Ste14
MRHALEGTHRTREADLQTPNVVIKPPTLYFAAFVLGLIVELLDPLPLLPPGSLVQIRIPFGACLSIVGVVLMALAIRQFARAGTNVPTNQPVEAFVTNGLYAYSRNPIYVGLALIYFGIAIVANSFWLVILWVPVAIIMRHGVVAREEAHLRAKFHEDYEHYSSEVRRWL